MLGSLSSPGLILGVKAHQAWYQKSKLTRSDIGSQGSPSLISEVWAHQVWYWESRLTKPDIRSLGSSGMILGVEAYQAWYQKSALLSGMILGVVAHQAWYQKPGLSGMILGVKAHQAWYQKSGLIRYDSGSWGLPSLISEAWAHQVRYTFKSAKLFWLHSMDSCTPNSQALISQLLVTYNYF